MERNSPEVLLKIDKQNRTREKFDSDHASEGELFSHNKKTPSLRHVQNEFGGLISDNRNYFIAACPQ